MLLWICATVLGVFWACLVVLAVRGARRVAVARRDAEAVAVAWAVSADIGSAVVAVPDVGPLPADAGVFGGPVDGGSGVQAAAVAAWVFDEGAGVVGGPPAGSLLPEPVVLAGGLVLDGVQLPDEDYPRWLI